MVYKHIRKNIGKHFYNFIVKKDCKRSFGVRGKMEETLIDWINSGEKNVPQTSVKDK